MKAGTVNAISLRGFPQFTYIPRSLSYLQNAATYLAEKETFFYRNLTQISFWFHVRHRFVGQKFKFVL